MSTQPTRKYFPEQPPPQQRSMGLPTQQPGAPIVGSPQQRSMGLPNNPANPANRNNLAGAKRGMRAEAMRAAALRRAKQYQNKTNLRNTAGNLGKQIPEVNR